MPILNVVGVCVLQLTGLPGFPTPLPDSLQSGIPGAFQPKSLPGIPPVIGPMFLGGRDGDKPSTLLPPHSSPSISAPKVEINVSIFDVCLVT